MKRSILCTFFVLTVTFLLLVRTQEQECTCGDLGLGKNPCSCSKTVVKAVELPKPSYYVSPEEINAAAVARNGMIYQSLGGAAAQPGSISYSSDSDSSMYSGGSLNTYGSSSSKVYGDSSTYDSSSILYNNPLPVVDGYGNGNSGCGCNKRIVESSDVVSTDDTINSGGNVVPRFPPIGDLCSPLPNLRSQQLLERTKVTPAYPGKIQCNNCNKVPYELCVNAVTGETTGRTTVSNSFGVAGESSPVIYGKLNVAAASSGSLPAIANARMGAASGLRSYGNFNSESSTSSRFGTYERSNSGLFGRLDSRMPGSLSSLVYANSNGAAGQRQYAKVSTSSSFSNCDDDADETQADYSYPEMPADAVSLTLAYKNLRAPNVIYRQGKQFVPEDKLSFGHRTVPNDVKNGRQIPEIAEEKLVTMEKPVMELKIAPPRTVVIGSYDEREEAKLAELEAIERESITQEETVGQEADGLLSYKDLGYAPVGSTYVNSQGYGGIMRGESDDSMEEPCGPLGPPIPDYVPGSIVVQRDVVENADCDNGNTDKNAEIQQTNPSGFGSYST